jgi:DNA-directed RNA polymerase specialized sigma24 family protein
MAAPVGESRDFWRAQHPRLLRYLAERGASWADAEDAAQVVFMAVWY